MTSQETQVTIKVILQKDKPTEEKHYWKSWFNNFAVMFYTNVDVLARYF